MNKFFNDGNFCNDKNNKNDFYLGVDFSNDSLEVYSIINLLALAVIRLKIKSNNSINQNSIQVVSNNSRYNYKK